MSSSLEMWKLTIDTLMQESDEHSDIRRYNYYYEATLLLVLMGLLIILFLGRASRSEERTQHPTLSVV